MIAVLMATYNGEKYVAEQIESLLRQTRQDFIIYINDDQSTDGTYKILKSYAEKYSQKIFVSQSETNSGNAKHNFIQMMIRHKAEYVMLCDQDDVWKPDKIDLTLQKMQEMETRYGKDVPILVHTDLEVVDGQLKTISPSFMKAMNADYSRTALRQQVIQNTLTGCTAMYNRALADLIQVEPRYMVMHDWWLILIASAFGKVGHLDAATILYRQHGNNSIGAKDVRTLHYKLNKLLHWQEMKKAIEQTYSQAQSLLDVYGEQLSEDQKAFLSAYCDIPKFNKMGRWLAICRLGVLKHGIARKIANFIFI